MEKIKDLRRLTSAALTECTKALNACEGNVHEAAKWLARAGAVVSEGKLLRKASEGAINTAQSPDNRKAVVVEVNTETDFVAKNDAFKQLVQSLTGFCLDQSVVPSPLQVRHNFDIEQLKTQTLPTGDLVADAVNKLVFLTGENCVLRRAFQVIAGPNQFISSYTHLGRIAAVVVLDCGVPPQSLESTDALRQVGFNIAVHVASVAPRFRTLDDVPEGVERDMAAKAKPDRSPVLLRQALIMGVDVPVPVQQYLQDQGRRLGLPGLTVAAFFRLERGEDEGSA